MFLAPSVESDGQRSLGLFWGALDSSLVCTSVSVPTACWGPYYGS